MRGRGTGPLRSPVIWQFVPPAFNFLVLIIAWLVTAGLLLLLLAGIFHSILLILTGTLRMIALLLLVAVLSATLLISVAIHEHSFDGLPGRYGRVVRAPHRNASFNIARLEDRHQSRASSHDARQQRCHYQAK
jgi:hypothetical protein